MEEGGLCGRQCLVVMGGERKRKEQSDSAISSRSFGDQRAPGRRQQKYV